MVFVIILFFASSNTSLSSTLEAEVIQVDFLLIQNVTVWTIEKRIRKKVDNVSGVIMFYNILRSLWQWFKALYTRQKNDRIVIVWDILTAVCEGARR